MNTVDVATLRALAPHHVELETAYGTYRGRLASATFGEFAVTILFAVDGADPADPLVIAVADIRGARRVA